MMTSQWLGGRPVSYTVEQLLIFTLLEHFQDLHISTQLNIEDLKFNFKHFQDIQIIKGAEKFKTISNIAVSNIF